MIYHAGIMHKQIHNLIMLGSHFSLLLAIVTAVFRALQILSLQSASKFDISVNIYKCKFILQSRNRHS